MGSGADRLKKKKKKKNRVRSKGISLSDFAVGRLHGKKTNNR